MQIHELKRKTKLAKKRYVGRGGKRGTTSGRGTKGQKARAGHKMYPEIRDMIKKIPKLRGYRFHSIETKPAAINLNLIESKFNAGETVSPKSLNEKKIIKSQGGRLPVVKILGKGKLTKKLTFTGCLYSAQAVAQIEKTGGEVVK